jgi:hypothetical protein
MINAGGAMLQPLLQNLQALPAGVWILAVVLIVLLPFLIRWFIRNFQLGEVVIGFLTFIRKPKASVPPAPVPPPPVHQSGGRSVVNLGSVGTIITGDVTIQPPPPSGSEPSRTPPSKERFWPASLMNDAATKEYTILSAARSSRFT